jgi:hypothetical protein
VNLVGFTSSGLSQTNWAGFHENLPERLDRLIGEERMPPVVVAFPDCFTRLGGNQYINSASMGAWEDFLLHEMLPAIEQRFGCGGLGRRGVFGKSSGGYGASRTRCATLTSGRPRPVIPAICASSCVICPTCPRSCAHSPAWRTRSNAGGSSSKRPESTRRVLASGQRADGQLYPDPTQFLGIRLPVAFDTCEVIEERWRPQVRATAERAWHSASLRGVSG